MFRDHHILKTNKLPNLQHVFSSKKHKIFRSYEKQTAETYLTKMMVVKDQKIFNHYKHHIVNNILPYLNKSKHLQYSSVISLQQQLGLVMIKASYEDQENQDYNFSRSVEQSQNNNARKQKDTNNIYITKKLVKGVTLRQMILNKDERLDSQFCLDLVNQIVDFILVGGGIKDFFISTENIIVEDTGLIYLNYFSFVGLQFSKYDKYITKAQFQQILPYLTTKFIKQTNPQQRIIDTQMQLRFIMLNFISAFLKRDLIFDNKHFDLQVEVRRIDKKIYQAVQKVNSSLMPNLLSQQDYNKIKQFDQKYHVNYLQLLNMLNIKRSQNKDQRSKISSDTSVINWEKILSKLSKTNYNNQSQISQITDNSQLQRDQQQLKYYLSKQKNYEYHTFFSMVFLDAVDIFISIITLVSQNLKQGKYSKQFYQNKRDQQKLHKLAAQYNEERQQYIQQEKYTESLYVPLKTGMTFTKVLKFQNWVNMLINSDSTDQFTLQSIIKLLKLVIIMGQTIKQIGPLINVEVILISCKNKKCNHEGISTFKNITLYSLLQNHQQKMMQSSIIKIFWNNYFLIINKLLLLIKNFKLKAIKHKMSHNIQINRSQFIKTISKINTDYIPQIPESLPMNNAVIKPIKQTELQQTPQQIKKVNQQHQNIPI